MRKNILAFSVIFIALIVVDFARTDNKHQFDNPSEVLGWLCGQILIAAIITLVFRLIDPYLIDKKKK